MRTKLLLLFILIAMISKINAQNNSSLDSAYKHLKNEFEQYHKVSYVYKDDNCGGNIYIPSIFDGEIINTKINQSYIDTSFYGRSCTKIFLKPTDSFSAIKYVYPENDTGNHHGYDMSGATKLTFQAKGNGAVEFMLGGINRRPFYNSSLPFQDGSDLRSTGMVNLTNSWQNYSIDLTDNRFWVYLDSTAGMKNKYCQPMYMDYFSYLNFYYGGDDGQGNKCMKLYWFGDSTYWAGVFLFPPNGDFTGTQGYNLTGITKIRFRSKISSSGNVRFLFGKASDSCGQLTNTLSLDTIWHWYEWNLPNGNYSNVVGGFGFYVGGNIGTPNYSTTYIDSVYYEGVELAHDFSNLICGFNVSATKSLNPDSAVIYLDEVSYNKDRTNQPHFCQSFVCGYDSIDITLKNKADVYDNSLTLIVDLMMYKITNDTSYLFSAKLIGDAFIFAQNHDRKFQDGRLRNSYMCGDLQSSDTVVRLPGWREYTDTIWHEDINSVSTSTGNMAWAGIALMSLYEATNHYQYLVAAKDIAQWCIDSTETSFGFTGGFEGYDTSQTKISWKSTEHNIDLYVLFSRLKYFTNDTLYNNAALKAKTFVLSMWDSTNDHFWTGTINNGITPNISFNSTPLDIQAWYLMAFLDSTSNYSNGINWAYTNCYLPNFLSQNYPQNLNGFDFNPDKDGIWFEGTAHSSLAFRMKNDTSLTNSLFSNIEYVQNHHNSPHFYNLNYKGIVAADHNNTTNGYNGYYHNRLHIGATSWYILAKLRKNPYYYDYFPFSTIVNEINNNILIYPNPAKEQITVDLQRNFNLMNVDLIIFDINGKLLYKQSVKQEKTIINTTKLSKGFYIIKVIDNKKAIVKKFIKD